MRFIRKIAAITLAAAMTVGFTGIQASAEEPTITIGSSTSSPFSSGAIGGGYSVGLREIKEGTTFSLTVTSYVPLTSPEEYLDIRSINSDSIFCIATTNSSFSTESSYVYNPSLSVVGGFLRVDTIFSNLSYLGKGNQFDYSICYVSDSGSTSVPLSVTVNECKESTEDEVVAPIFILNSYTKSAVKAGSSATINVGLRRTNAGAFKTVTAMLSSADKNITVEDVGEMTSYSTSPSFNFKISVPASTPEGIYSLSMAVNVYSEKGAVITTSTYTIPVKVQSDIKAAGLTVSSYKVSRDTVKSGNNFSLTLTLKNNCGIDLSNVSVSLENLLPAKFVLDGGFSEQTVSIKKGKTADVKFSLVACNGIDSIRETIDIKAVYRTNPAEPSTEQSLSTSVIITCEPANGNAGKYDLTMTNYLVSSPSVTEKTKFNVSVTVKNNGKTKINNARISLLNLDGTKFAVNEGLTYADFNIGAGKSEKFTFSLIGCAGISSIREVIPVEIAYGETTTTLSVTVSCVPSSTAPGVESEVFAPNIIITSYNYGEEYVLAGQQFPLNLTIENTSSQAVIENLKVTISGGSSGSDGTIAFSPANSSNSFFFNTLSVRGTTDVGLDLLAKADAAPNSYPINISFEYEYTVGGKHYKANEITETITIPLQQEDRLTSTITDIPSDMVISGQPFNVAASLVNKGKSGIYNLTVTVEGEGFMSETTSEYIGNVASGTEEYFETSLTPYMDGDISGDIVITYEDANGTEKEQRLPFTVSAMSYDMGYDDGGMYPGDGEIYPDDGGGYIDGEMPSEGGDMTWLWFVIGGGVVVVAGVIITICVVTKKKRAKAEMDEDEDI